MARVGVPAGLVVAILMLCGCSSAVQRVDLGEWHKYLAKDPYTGGDVPRPGNVASPTSPPITASAPRATVARDLIERAEREEAVARSDFRLRASVGRNVQEPLGPDEAQERSLKGKIQSTFRSC